MLWHNPQVVVLLLLIAIQRKPNEDLIARIDTLDFETQRNIMYITENGQGRPTFTPTSSRTSFPESSLLTFPSLSLPSLPSQNSSSPFFHSCKCSSVASVQI